MYIFHSANQMQIYMLLHLFDNYCKNLYFNQNLTRCLIASHELKVVPNCCKTKCA